MKTYTVTRLDGSAPSATADEHTLVEVRKAVSENGAYAVVVRARRVRA